MSLADYTEAAEDGKCVRHDALARFIVTTGGEVLEDSLTPVATLGGAITLAGFTYNRLSMSGGVSWWNPETGLPIEKPKYEIRLRPEDILCEGELCPCVECKEAA